MLILRYQQASEVEYRASSAVLIGSAPHCHIQIPGLQPLCAVAVSYAAGWLLHDLRSGDVQVNGDRIDSRIGICSGDRWTIGNVTFTVEVENESLRGRGSVPPPQSCALHIEDVSGLHVHEISQDTLLGDSSVCDIVLPPQERLTPMHCLFSQVGGRWHLISLSRRGGRRNGNRWEEWIILNENDEIHVKPLRIVVKLIPMAAPMVEKSAVAVTPALPALVNAIPAAVVEKSPVIDPPEEPVAESEIPAPGKADVDGEDGRSHSGETAAMASVDTSVSHPLNVEAQQMAQRIYDSIKEQHLLQTPPKRTIGLMWRRFHSYLRCRAIEDEFARGNALLALQQMHEMLKADAWNRSLLLTFARMCDVSGTTELCLFVLIRLYQLYPEDTVVNRSLARICRHLGDSDDPRFLIKSMQFWKFIQRRHPEEDRAIQRTLDVLNYQVTLQSGAQKSRS